MAVNQVVGTGELKAVKSLRQERCCRSMAAAAKESDVFLEWCFTSTVDHRGDVSS